MIVAAFPLSGAEIAKTYEESVAKAIEYLASKPRADGSYRAGRPAPPSLP